MIYEFQVQYVKVDRNGNDKSVKEWFATEKYETFTEIEAFAMDYFGEYAGIDVVAIKRSRVSEIINSRCNDCEVIWEATLQATYLIDNVEKTMKYRVLLYAKTFDEAKVMIENYLSQGYDMDLVSLKVTAIKDVL